MVWKMSNSQLDGFIAAALDLRASDLHIIAGVPPAFRVNGDILFADHDALSPHEAAEICYSFLNVEQRQQFKRDYRSARGAHGYAFVRSRSRSYLKTGSRCHRRRRNAGS